MSADPATAPAQQTGAGATRQAADGTAPDGGPGTRAERRGRVRRERVALAASIATLAAAITLAAALAGDFPVASTEPLSIPVAAATADLVCPGPETLMVPEGAQAVSTGGRQAVTASLSGAAGGSEQPAAAFGRLNVRSATPAQPNLGATAGVVDLATVVPKGAGAYLLQAGSGQPGAPPLIAAAQVGLATSGDLRGLTALPCGPAVAEAWLVGGSTRTGNRSRVLLANPMSLPAVVDLRLLGPKGPVETPNGDGIVVPPGRQVAVALDALAPGQNLLAVHVLARSGRVAVSLFDTVLRGLVPGGTDDVLPAAAPARRAVVPGVELGPGQGAGGTAVRIVAPGTRDAVVSVRLLGPSGPVRVPGGVLAVRAGSVAEVRLGKLDGVVPGTYAVLVDADVPVTAAVRIGRGAPGSEVAGSASALGLNIPPSEFAWAVATPALSGTSPAAGDGALARKGDLLATVPALGAVGVGNGQVRLSLTNVGPAKVVLPVRQGDAAGKVGPPVEITLPAGTTVVTPLSAGASALLLPEAAGVHAALVVTAADAKGPLLTVLPVAPPLTLGHSSLVSVPDPRLGLPAD